MDPLPAWLKKLWDAWDIRVMVLISLMLQITLIYCGGRRKNLRGILIDVFVWSTYLMADAAAMFSLGKLSDASSGEDESATDNKQAENNGLMVLWAPILLIHLGGPDTITAYSVEDLRLWLRHAFTVTMQVTLAVYVLLRFWTGNPELVVYLTFPLFVTGIIKYTERTWVLWCTNSVYPNPILPIAFSDPKVVDNLDTADGDQYSDAKLVGFSYLWLQAMASCILEAGRFDQQFASSEVTKIIWNKANVNMAFKFSEVQLGFMYEVLYTKANKIYTKVGCVIRLVSFVCVASALLGYIIIRKNDYSRVDIIVTYALLVGALVLELYAILLIICSDFAIIWMCKHSKHKLVKCVLRILAPLVVRYGKRWAGSLPTLNVLDLALYKVKPPMLRQVVMYYDLEEKFKAFMCQRDIYDFESVKLVIKNEVRRLLDFFSKQKNWHRNYEERGELALDNWHNHCKKELKWSVSKNIDINIVLWHIATTCCFYLDNENNEKMSYLREGSKIMSDYMMYLLVNHPSLLGKNVSSCNLSALLGSYVQLMEDVKREEISSDKAEICRRMMKWEPNVCTPSRRSNTATLSPLDYGRIPIEACDLATTLMSEKYKDEKWVIISEIWAEMLFHGAAKCQPTEHLNKLPKGGEFISQVWILLFIHGLTQPSPRDFLRPMFAKVEAEEV